MRMSNIWRMSFTQGTSGPRPFHVLRTTQQWYVSNPYHYDAELHGRAGDVPFEKREQELPSGCTRSKKGDRR